jgi:hypothetical protein
MQKSKSIHAFFTIISQINEQIIDIGDSIEEVELVMTTLNGLPKSWDSFIRGICSRSKLTKFNRLWEDSVQEEARLEAREENLSNDEDQALAAHFRKGKKKKENHPPQKKFQKFEKGKRDYSKLKCVNVYAIIIVLCISIDKSIIRTRSLRNTHSQETQHLSWETL